MVNSVEELTLDNMIKFLEGKPASKRYDAFRIKGCLLANFIGANNSNERSAGIHTVSFDGKNLVQVPLELQMVAFGGRHHSEDDDRLDPDGNFYTFGAALERARGLKNR